MMIEQLAVLSLDALDLPDDSQLLPVKADRSINAIVGNFCSTPPIRFDYIDVELDPTVIQTNSVMIEYLIVQAN